MRIVHIAPNSPFNDNWGYQENLLPKYQKQMNNDVTLITTTMSHQNGKIIKVEENDYNSDDGVRIIRKNYKKYLFPHVTGIFCFIPVYDLLEKIKPDLVFYHGLVSYTIFDVIKYKKMNPSCIIVQDNHMDYNIGNKINTLKDRIIRSWLRFINKKSIKYVKKVYGVTPWRKQYAEDYFHIPPCKTDVLIMGADDEQMNLQNRENIRKMLRKRYDIKDKDFLIVTGGKIDKNKKIDLLMDACKKLKGVKLLVFGNVADELKEKIEKLSCCDNILFIGWIDSKDVYNYFYAADLVIFPGQHSVLWEQACASKVPCVFEKWPGMDHVNNGGNSCFIEDVSVSNLKKIINELLYTKKYYEMKKVAESNKTSIYLYSEIAKKSLEVIKK